jgi:Transcriptional regulators
VNSVISSLVTEGLLYVEQGRGTFVAEKRQSTRKGKKIIGVMLFDFRVENNVEAAIFNSIQEQLKEDYYVIPYNSYDNNDMFYKGLKGFNELDVDGMILVPPSSENYDEALINSLIKKDMPVVLINRRISTIRADFLMADFGQGIYIGTRYILDSGKRKIALLKHNSPSIAPLMFEGYKKAHLEFKADIHEDLILDWTDDKELLEARLAGLLDRIDGMIASDYFIYKIRKAIYDSKKKIPRDISLVGFNDTIYSKVMNPPLTAVLYPSVELGREAVNMIMDRIENNRSEVSEKYIVPELIIRSS